MMCVQRVDPGIDCAVADNGVRALEVLAASAYTPNYIFLDVNMPKMNGLECLQQLRAIPRLADTKIFIYSTTSENKVVQLSKEYGASEFIVKPAKIAELMEILTRVLAPGTAGTTTPV